MATIDLRKEPKTLYPQDFLAHFLGHHMQCGHTHLLFRHLIVLDYLKNAFNQETFSYDYYKMTCEEHHVEPTSMFKPKRCFVAHITIYKDEMMSPDINIYPTNEWASNYTPKFFEIHHTPTYGVCYIHELRDYNGQFALEQIVSLCSEYFAHKNDV